MTFLPVVGLTIEALVVFAVPPMSNLQYTEKMNIILTSALVIFACLEGYSTYGQLVLQDKRNAIEDARNELEKAYGPLFSILNYRAKGDEKFLRIEQNDFETIDEIMAIYPWIFPAGINDLWSKTRRPVPVLYGKDYTEPLNDVSFEFRDRINEEYQQRLKRYKELLKKEENSRPLEQKRTTN